MGFCGLGSPAAKGVYFPDMDNRTEHKTFHTAQRITNALLFLIWGVLSLFILFASTAHGLIVFLHEVLFIIAIITIGFYPVSLILSIFSNSEKILKLPKRAIVIQFFMAVLVYISRLAID